MTSTVSSTLLRQACLESAKHHERLCPRQVLGVRMGLAALERLGPASPSDRRLIVFAEIDGCFVDGVIAATGCTVGHRTLRVVDYGRVALTAVDTTTSEAIRIAPRPGLRDRAAEYAPDEAGRYEQQVLGYERMPLDGLLRIEPVTITLDLCALIGRPGIREDCVRCGEEVLNGREIATDDGPTCPGCAAPAYYSAPLALSTRMPPGTHPPQGVRPTDRSSPH